MEEILVALSVIGVIVTAVTQLTKSMFSNKKYLPIYNVIIGIVLGLLYAYTITKGDYSIYGWAGALAGLGAGGFYDLGVNTKAIVNENEAQNLINDGKGEQS